MSAKDAATKSMEIDTKAEEKPKETQQPQQPQLGVLEEDDEFEEFPVADWEDSETMVSKLLQKPGLGESGGPSQHLWEDNWDDDDVEDDFSVQLREQLAKGAKPSKKDAMET